MGPSKGLGHQTKRSSHKFPLLKIIGINRFSEATNTLNSTTAFDEFTEYPKENLNFGCKGCGYGEEDKQTQKGITGEQWKES